MWFGVISLFPDSFQYIKSGITGRALTKNQIAIEYWNPRDFDTDKYKSADDHPYGGGPGMLMKALPLQLALRAAKAKAPCPPKTIYLSPQGKVFDQSAAKAFAQEKALIFLAGRYEGIDERVIHQEIDEEWSIGDYVVSGGELPAMVMMDAITRLLPGVLGDETSALQDSLFNGLLKYPQYTRPEVFNNEKVPDVLLSGDHQAIETWRLKESLGRTFARRPDLLAKKRLTSREKALLDEWIRENLQK